MLRFAVVLNLSLVLVNCASLKSPEGAGQSVRIELKGKPGTSTETRYYSNANVKTYSQGQLLRDKQEIVDFTTLTTVKKYDEQEQVLQYTVKTVKKDGMVELHDLAFPEKGEEIEFWARKTGQVVRAGDYPPQSLFFVPGLPVPKDEVTVGDTWTMEHTWLSSRDNIPLKLDIVGILKDIVSCDGGKKCADIEVSGNVKLATAATIEGARFDSRVWGRMLFSLDRGDVIWSEMRSQEEMALAGEKFAVMSCMKSETLIGAKLKTNLECTPAVSAVTSVPKL